VTVEGSRRAAERHGLAHEVIDRARLARRFPQFRVGDDFAALYEPDAGYLLCERVIAVQTRLALDHGITLRGGECVIEWAADSEGASVRTDRGEHRARTIVFTAGAWATRIVTDLGVRVTPTRQALGWVRPKAPAMFAVGALPVWAIDAAHLGEGLYYGFPMSESPDEPEGLKLARHLAGPPTDPDGDDRAPVAAAVGSFRPALRRWLPDADGPLLAVRTCMYENSPDQHFIIDRHPRRPNALVACGFSGHGFKFASVVGEILADLALDGATRHPIGFLGLSRFGARA
jgi:sarcosine oxidase